MHGVRRKEVMERILPENIKALMEYLKFSAKQAMEALDIPLQEQEKYASRLLSNAFDFDEHLMHKAIKNDEKS